MTDDRPVIRCPHCKLNQFMTVSGNCRKCRKELALPEPVLVVEEKPVEMRPVKVEVVVVKPSVPRQPRRPYIHRSRGVTKRQSDWAIGRKKQQIKPTAQGAYQLFKNAKTAEERREIIRKYLAS